MNLPKIYNFLDQKYIPIVRYINILPEKEFISFISSVKEKRGLAREFHGYEFEGDKIEFWDDSGDIEKIVTINTEDLLDILKPLINSFLQLNPEEKTVFEEVINFGTTKLDRNYSNIEKNFLEELEWFFRNYGNQWSISDFSNKIKNNENKLERLLSDLSLSGVIRFTDESKKSFKILKLPSTNG